MGVKTSNVIREVYSGKEDHFHLSGLRSGADYYFRVKVSGTEETAVFQSHEPVRADTSLFDSLLSLLVASAHLVTDARLATRLRM